MGDVGTAVGIVVGSGVGHVPQRIGQSLRTISDIEQSSPLRVEHNGWFER